MARGAWPARVLTWACARCTLKESGPWSHWQNHAGCLDEELSQSDEVPAAQKGQEKDAGTLRATVRHRRTSSHHQLDRLRQNRRRSRSRRRQPRRGGRARATGSRRARGERASSRCCHGCERRRSGCARPVRPLCASSRATSQRQRGGRRRAPRVGSGSPVLACVSEPSRFAITHYRRLSDRSREPVFQGLGGRPADSEGDRGFL